MSHISFGIILVTRVYYIHSAAMAVVVVGGWWCCPWTKLNSLLFLLLTIERRQEEENECRRRRFILGVKRVNFRQSIRPRLWATDERETVREREIENQSFVYHSFAMLLYEYILIEWFLLFKVSSSWIVPHNSLSEYYLSLSLPLLSSRVWDKALVM